MVQKVVNWLDLKPAWIAILLTVVSGCGGILWQAAQFETHANDRFDRLEEKLEIQEKQIIEFQQYLRTHSEKMGYTPSKQDYDGSQNAVSEPRY